MIDYVVWGTETVPHCFVLNELEGVDLDVELRTGVPCSESFPPNAVFTVDPDFPNNTKLADTFYNTQRLVIVSEKLKEFIATWNPPEVEFLPVTILNHKSRPTGKYFIVHPIHPVDALNPSKSGATWSKRNKERIDDITNLVLNKDKIDPARLMLKLRYFHKCVLIRKDLADAISKKGFTGIKWTECEEYEP
jgi:hypothetical protein